MNYTSRFYHWLKRITKRKGYGIHSPYAFSFVTEVVYNESAYYAYEKLEHEFKTHSPKRPIKDYRLLFRVTNFFCPTHITSLLSSNELEHQYIHEACPSRPILTGIDIPKKTARPILFVDTANRFKEIHKHFDAQTSDSKTISPFAIVCLDIHLYHENWKQMRRLFAKQGVISFDLSRIGIIIREKHLKQQDYDIAYL